MAYSTVDCSYEAIALVGSTHSVSKTSNNKERGKILAVVDHFMTIPDFVDEKKIVAKFFVLMATRLSAYTLQQSVFWNWGMKLSKSFWDKGCHGDSITVSIRQIIYSRKAGPKHYDACQLSNSKFPRSIFTPGSTEYEVETQSRLYIAYGQGIILIIPRILVFGCLTRTQCVLAPARSSDLADRVDIFIKSNTTFIVRSGGHDPTTKLP
ncbi:hypothetical protein CC78DRAFT_548968 [Lojkania enalia]|uniref:Uncharacterized protein n=1 Tax=Lojkania enalia TaxID=147567 RepID=A0A9P4K382_9PLEO|nr:hypothetical protein CC78DRAFT_548968 [Didymosphaeria enalia]